MNGSAGQLDTEAFGSELEAASRSFGLHWLQHAPHGVLRPPYDPTKATIGVVHFGPGAFHRVHQAAYFDAVLATQPDWAISAVSLKSPQLRDSLDPQDGLYTMAVLDQQTQYRVIGALRERLVAAEDPARVLHRLVDPATRLVTLTVTEKGYCLDAQGQLDLNHPDIQHDLAHPGQPCSVIGYLLSALAARRAAGIAPFSVLSCDNLVDNGVKLGQAVVTLAAQSNRSLADWIEAEVAFPCSMVDSITPATDSALRQRVTAALGVVDRWPVQREAFSQWVLERRFCNVVPDFAAVGISLTDDVRAWEQAKLRLLNGAHSALAYLGVLAGHATVGAAMADPRLSTYIEQLMELDIGPSVHAPAGLDLAAYSRTVRQRFRNPAISHQLAQIAWDGSQKLPFRLFGTLRDALTAQRDLSRLALAVAAWLHFLRLRAATGVQLVDPLAPVLLDTAGRCSGAAPHDVSLFLALDGVFPADLAKAPRFVEALTAAYAQLENLPN